MAEFLDLLAGLGDYRLIHFGRYERDFIREMQRRYPFGGEEEAERLLSRLFDVHRSHPHQRVLSGLQQRPQGNCNVPRVSVAGAGAIWDRQHCLAATDGRRQGRMLQAGLCSGTITRTAWRLPPSSTILASFRRDPIGTAVQCEETDGLPDTKGGNFQQKGVCHPCSESDHEVCLFQLPAREGLLSHGQERQKKRSPQTADASQARPR